MMEMMDLTALQDEWFPCMSTGMDFSDWSMCMLPEISFKSRKSVRFKSPLVTSYHTRPRETPEECDRLYFTDEELQAMKQRYHIHMLAKQVEKTDRPRDSRGTPHELLPKFETVAKKGSEVKVMYAVPKKGRKSSSRSCTK